MTCAFQPSANNGRAVNTEVRITNTSEQKIAQLPKLVTTRLPAQMNCEYEQIKLSLRASFLDTPKTATYHACFRVCRNCRLRYVRVAF